MLKPIINKGREQQYSAKKIRGKKNLTTQQHYSVLQSQFGFFKQYFIMP